MTETDAAVKAIRIALVDDQPLFSAGLKMILRSQPDLDFVGEANDGAAAVELAAAVGPDIMLMDIRMPVMDGITATRAITSGPAAPPKVIVLTTIQHDEAVVRAIQAGAAGFLTKDATPEFLLAAIRTVHSGHAVMAPHATNHLLRD
jgi:DNA-binding NarL/FixJ family response regulator